MIASHPRRPGGRSARVRESVLAAVRARLVETGYDGLSVDAIAEHSGVHRTTIYRRWHDIGGLLADVLLAAADDTWRPADTGSLEGDLAAIATEVYAALTADPPITNAIIAASFRSDEAAHALRDFWTDRYARCAVVVRRAIERGEAAAGTDAERLLTAATAPLYHRLLLWRVPEDEDFALRVARDVAIGAAAGAFAQRAG